MGIGILIMFILAAVAGLCFAVSALCEKKANYHGEKAYGKEKWAQICKEQAEYNKEENVIERERIAAINSHNATEPWAVKYSTSPCPYCGHYKVRYAKWEDKSMSIAFWGIASSKIGTNYKCEHCNRMW